MRPHLPLFLGVFAIMALSNAIVPVLPAYSTDASQHGMIYAAYFLGAFLITLPAGILSDRYGRMPLIQMGLSITVTSGLILAVTVNPLTVVLIRFVEGVGAGLFVAAAMSAVNSNPDHIHLSGWLMASMNTGLVAGLILAGGLASALHQPAAGILFFALLASVPAGLSLLVPEPPGTPAPPMNGRILWFLGQYRWLWYSAIVLIGITGVITSLYPRLSGASPVMLSYWIAGMSIATIVAVIIYSRTTLPPLPAIRWSAILAAAAVIVSFWSPVGIIFLGAIAGVVMLAQMAFLSADRGHQGILMGIFSSTSYLGMALLPAAAGFVAVGLGFLPAFCLTALAALSVAVMIGRCPCPSSP